MSTSAVHPPGVAVAVADGEEAEEEELKLASKGPNFEVFRGEDTAKPFFVLFSSPKLCQRVERMNFRI